MSCELASHKEFRHACLRSVIAPKIVYFVGFLIMSPLADTIAANSGGRRCKEKRKVGHTWRKPVRWPLRSTIIIPMHRPRKWSGIWKSWQRTWNTIWKMKSCAASCFPLPGISGSTRKWRNRSYQPAEKTLKMEKWPLGQPGLSNQLFRCRFYWYDPYLASKEGPHAGANGKVPSWNAGAAKKLNDCETHYYPIEKRPCRGMQGRLFIAFKGLKLLYFRSVRII